MNNNSSPESLQSIGNIANNLAKLVDWIDTHGAKSGWKKYDTHKTYSQIIPQFEFLFREEKVRIKYDGIGLCACVPKKAFGIYENENEFWNNVMDFLKEDEEGIKSREWEENNNSIEFRLYKSIPEIVNGFKVGMKFKFSMPLGMRDTRDA